VYTCDNNSEKEFWICKEAWLKTGSFHEVHLSQAYDDPAWDSFIETVEDGQFEQTSRWAKVKQLAGWEPLRFSVLGGQQRIAGCQILVRELPLIGCVGYVSKGPVFSFESEDLVYFVIKFLSRLCRRRRIRYLVIELPDNGHAIEPQLMKMGFLRDARLKADRATTVIDLTPELDDILAKMTKNNRRFIRHGERKGVKVREGSEKDIGLFFRMMVETCNRQGEKPNPPEDKFFYEIWRVLGSCGQAKLFLAEYADTIVAGLFCIPFGKVVRAWKLGWSGEYGQVRPNQVMFWESIKWAKDAGYKYYDFVGINRKAAEMILEGKHFSDVAKRDSFFKLMFGGEVRLLPDVYTYIYNPILRVSYRNIYPRISNTYVFSRLVEKGIGYSPKGI
jgi:peptidoglycan pentaglycine glycine transferase (the first glycine)